MSLSWSNKDRVGLLCIVRAGFNNHVADHLGDSSTVDLWTMLLNDNGVESADNLQVQI